MAPGVRWDNAYDRSTLPTKVLMFGTGMLLRALVGTAVDDANRAARYRGGIVALQSTESNRAAALNAQDGLFTVVERGFERGEQVDRARVVGSITRALTVAGHWSAIGELVANDELNVIVSNVTEAGFQPGSFPATLCDLLHERFIRNRDAPPLYLIPTELVPDNGPRLRRMITDERNAAKRGEGFANWLDEHVVFCSSLVDRITTAVPDRERDVFNNRLGYADNLLTITEPSALWAVACDPSELRAALPVDDGARVVFARDIAFYRDRKLRLLNGAHTAMAPVALLAGVATVREATAHPRLGAFFRRLLFDELVPGSGVPRAQAEWYAESTWDRFRNPWLDHEWSVIANNQDEKMRIRVIPSIVAYNETIARTPRLLALALAAHVVRAGLTASSLRDATRWGAPIASIARLEADVGKSCTHIESHGMLAAIDAVLSATAVNVP